MYKLPADFPMQTLRKKSSPCKYKHEPSRFLGDGVSFRAKLIGVLEVSEARGDRMCQDALADLKMAVRAAGEHKQRIVIHVAIDGLRLRDDKTGDSLYHHPVHKISFIAQDMTDSRAFGYIFGSPDTGHRFFGIKTDKAASQVVIAMRDLFQVVFELKKKEIELAKQQLEGKSSSGSSGRYSSGLPTEFIKQKASLPETSQASANASVAELVDLEQELSSLRRGLSQVERLTPAPADPFGDSFTPPPSATGSGTFSLPKGLLPPPPPPSSTGTVTRGRPQRGLSSSPTGMVTPSTSNATPTAASQALPSLATVPIDTPAPVENVSMTQTQPSTSQQQPGAIPFDVFTELDPLGTGRSKPYVDKKNFFQELKNPPKKVLKDLVPTTSTNSISVLADSVQAKSDKTNNLERYQTPSMSSTSNHYSSAVFKDPFADSDPFEHDPFIDSYKEDPFNSSALSFDRRRISRDSSTEVKSDESARYEHRAYNGGLQVNLPPDTRSKREITSFQQIEVPPPPLPPKREPGPAPPPPRPHPRDNGDSADEYLTPRPPPLPGGKRKVKLDMTLSALASCGMSELAAKLDVPASMLSNMTLPQLTAYLKTYLDNSNGSPKEDKKALEQSVEKAPELIPKPPTVPSFKANFDVKFEDNFAHDDKEEVFVADFENFNKKVTPSYDRYAVFREIQEEELKQTGDGKRTASEKSREDGDGEESDSGKEEINKIDNMKELKEKKPVASKSPMQILDELAFESFNILKSTSVSPRNAPIESKIEDIKMVMKSIQIKDQNQPSASPGEQMLKKDGSDRYAALREITFVEPQQDEFESLPSDQPREGKKSDENTDNFDNSDFFDCVDNSSLSFSNVDDAFRKSPLISKEEKDTRAMPKIDEKEPTVSPCAPSQTLALARVSTGSLSDIVSGSSPEAGHKGSRSGAWSPLAATSSDEPAPPRPRRRTQPTSTYRTKQTSSSSRDVSPWEEEAVRPHRSHLRSSGSSHHRESRQNSSGSRECAESSGHERSRSGRDRTRAHRERDPGHFRDNYDDREHWERARHRSPRDRRENREIRREGSGRRRQQLSWGDEDDYSDGPHSGGSGDREYSERWESRSRRKDERNYNSLNWRESRRRMETPSRPVEDDRRYAWNSRQRRRRTPSPRRRLGGRVSSTDSRAERIARSDRSDRVSHTERLDWDVDRSDRISQTVSRIDNRLDRLPQSVDSRPALKEHISPAENRLERLPQPDTRTERLLLTENRRRSGTDPAGHPELRKSESVDIFARTAMDPFAEDDFFACTGSDRAARRDNWPGTFSAFDEEG